jgi:tetratricopeptide (TPR) repeat protein
MGMKKILNGSLLLAVLSAGLFRVQPAAFAQPAAFEQASEQWAQRGDPAMLKQAIAIYEKAYQPEPSQALAERLSYAYYFQADAFEEGEQKSKDYYTGYEWGIKALMFDPGFKQRYAVDKQGIGDAVNGVGKEFSGAIFWTATCYGKWGKMRNILKQLGPAKQARKMITYLYSIDKDYYYGGPARWLGAYYAIAPGIAGGDIKKSRQYYDEALAASPQYFATKVLMAENYYPKIKDRAGWDKALDEVINGDANALPEIAIEQKTEQDKAMKLKILKMED